MKLLSMLALAAATITPPHPASQLDAPDRVHARVRAAQEIAVAAQASGVVVARPVARNSIVKTGDVILRIDPTFAKLDVAKAKAALEKATADAQWADQELKREEELANSNSTQRATVEKMQARARAGHAAVANHRALFTEAEERLARCEVKAPADGLLAEIHPEIGEAVTLLAPVAELLTIDDLVVEAFLRGDEIVHFQKGGKVRVTVGTPPLGEMDGVVREVARAANRNRTFRLVVALHAPPKGLRPGFDATIALPKDL